MKFYPGKYLYIIPKKSINIESPNQKEIQTFQIKYPNMFCKLTINNLLNILEDEIQALNELENYIKCQPFSNCAQGSKNVGSPSRATYSRKEKY